VALAGDSDLQRGRAVLVTEDPCVAREFGFELDGGAGDPEAPPRAGAEAGTRADGTPPSADRQ
jgi:hypothetical protein